MKQIAIMLLIFLGLFVNVLGQEKNKTAEEAINEFWNLVLNDKIEDAMKFYDEKWFKNFDSAKAELEIIRIKEARIQNILNENKNGDVAALYVNVKDKNKTRYVYAFYVYKRTATGEWKIVDFFKRPNKVDTVKPKTPPKSRDNPINAVVDCPKCI